MSRGKVLLIAGAMALVVLWGGWIAVKWTLFRIYVGPDEMLVVINKFGNPLPPDRIVVPADDNAFKGVQEQVRGPGRYFLNPVEYAHEIHPLVIIPAGEPQKWDWDPDGNLKDPAVAPSVGLLTAKEGKTAPAGVEVVPPGFRGIQQQVLTPGVYKINPYQFEVTVVPAIVVPPGSVGVVTRLVGDATFVTSATLTEIRNATTGPSTRDASQPATAAVADSPDPAPGAPSRLVVGANQRGILKDVLQPGIYYINPRMAKITIVPVGYDAITLEHPDSAIRFYSYDGYLVEADFTVVWGRVPSDAPNIVANIGTIDRVRDNVIEPAMKAACQNEGAKYTARDLIQGLTRSQFQDDLSASLERQVAPRNIHVLLALIRNIAIKDAAGKDQTEGLLTTIQRANIEIERDLTNKQKTQTAAVAAELEQARKLVDVARERVAAETNVKVADILATGQKEAAEISALRDFDVAQVNAEIAALDAQRTEILGKAGADVAQLKRDAEAKGAKLMIDAFGTPQAYNKYIFARNFQPTDIRLIFAGPGTFWTDLKTFEQVGAAKILQPPTAIPPTPRLRDLGAR